MADPDASDLPATPLGSMVAHAVALIVEWDEARSRPPSPGLARTTTITSGTLARTECIAPTLRGDMSRPASTRLVGREHQRATGSGVMNDRLNRGEQHTIRKANRSDAALLSRLAAFAMRWLPKGAGALRCVVLDPRGPRALNPPALAGVRIFLPSGAIPRRATDERLDEAHAAAQHRARRTARASTLGSAVAGCCSWPRRCWYCRCR
jgi:hypothetical protein